jgi:hypothetical protein
MKQLVFSTTKLKQLYTSESKRNESETSAVSLSWTPREQTKHVGNEQFSHVISFAAKFG